MHKESVQITARTRMAWALFHCLAPALMSLRSLSALITHKLNICATFVVIVTILKILHAASPVDQP